VLLTVVLVLSAVVVALCRVAYLFIRQNGRILLRLDAIERHLARQSESSAGIKTGKPGSHSLLRSRINRTGLLPGTEAPPFRLRALEGREIALDQYRRRTLFVVFSDPNCGPCSILAPKLEQRWRELPHMEFLMISRGDEHTNRRKSEELGISFPIVLQRQWEISRLYGIFGTPVAYLIGGDGRIAAGPASGEQQILSLLTGEFVDTGTNALELLRRTS